MPKKPPNNDSNASKFGNYLVNIIKNKLEDKEIKLLIEELDQIIEIQHPMAHFNPAQILDKYITDIPEDVIKIEDRNLIMPHSAMLPGFTEKYYLELLTDDFIDPLFLVVQKLIYKFYITFN